MNEAALSKQKAKDELGSEIDEIKREIETETERLQQLKSSVVEVERKKNDAKTKLTSSADQVDKCQKNLKELMRFFLTPFEYLSHYPLDGAIIVLVRTRKTHLCVIISLCHFCS